MEFLCIEVEEACPVLQVCGRGLSIERLVSDAALDPRWISAFLEAEGVNEGVYQRC